MVLGGTIFALGLSLFTCFWTIPFVFESSSILYKFGIAKILLRSGKLVGITVALLVFLQILFVAHFPLIEGIFSRQQLLGGHRINGLLIALLGILHPVLILAADDFTFFRLEKRYWPQFLGIGVLGYLLAIVVFAYWRKKLALAYANWLFIHRLTVLLLMPVLLTHIIFVSETFSRGLPRYLAMTAAGLSFLCILRNRYRRLLSIS